MVFLWIVIILAVLIIALLSLNFKLYLKFDGTTHIRAGIGPVVFTLLPQKKKKIRLRRAANPSPAKKPCSRP